MKELLRLCLRPVATAPLHLRSQPLTLPTGSRCVIIAPHQDDEALGCAGLIATQRASDQSVAVVYVTDGAGSHPNHPRLSPTDIAQLRRSEAVRAMQKLGVPESALHFLNAPDGTLANLAPDAFDQLAARLAALLAPLQPNVLFLPCRNDSSSEHMGAHALTIRALKIAGIDPRVLEFPIWARWRPQQLFRLGLATRNVFRLAFPRMVVLKRDALGTYLSQVEPTPPWPNPILPYEFVRCFASAEEYFFEN